jgi:hypothetical protein
MAHNLAYENSNVFSMGVLLRCSQKILFRAHKGDRACKWCREMLLGEEIGDLVQYLVFFSIHNLFFHKSGLIQYYQRPPRKPAASGSIHKLMIIL